MLELKNVSKYYYNKGMVSSGFTKVSLKFNIGEFVAITGESGSGKSTLLNVISGLDSYEEGEMYIFGSETSHYTEKDYEIYRKKYIGNIFQNFNLINSYTVYQNVELILLLNGTKKKDAKAKTLEILKKVDLYKYKNKKVSRLSGGQKQRVAIARALASDTPIILADEPTGNLDKRSSESVLRLLHEISHDKLVIIVTHNYDQVEEYVTRKITMHDGRVLEDKKIKDYDDNIEIKERNYANIRPLSKMLLGFRNAFNIPVKFFLISFVYLFIVFALFFAYAAFAEGSDDSSDSNLNNYFSSLDNKRIIIKKNDRSAFSKEDYENILKIDNIDSIVKNDLLLDEFISLNNDNYYLYGNVRNVDDVTKVDLGSLPTQNNEIVVTMNENEVDYQKDIIGKKVSLDDLFNYTTNKKYELLITGIIITDGWAYNIYVSDKVQEDIGNNINKINTSLKYKFYDIEGTSNLYNVTGEIIGSSRVSSGKVIIPDDWSYVCPKSKCKGKAFKVNTKNIFFNESKSFEVSNTYTKKNFSSLTGYNFDNYNGAIFINDKDYNNLFNKGYYQSSVIIKNEKNVRDTISSLEKLNLKVLYIPDVSFPFSETFTRVINIIRVIVISILIIVLFFISYFIIRLILKSRNIYYSTIRILGASSKTTKDLLNIELLVVSHISYLIFIAFILLVKFKYIKNEIIYDLSSYVNYSTYLLMYIILLVMTFLIAYRYARKIFKDSAMNSYREEV